MADVQFNEEPSLAQKPQAVPRESFLVRLVTSTGLVKTVAGAHLVMLVLGVLVLLAAWYLFAATGGEPPAPAGPARM